MKQYQQIWQKLFKDGEQYNLIAAKSRSNYTRFANSTITENTTNHSMDFSVTLAHGEVGQSRLASRSAGGNNPQPVIDELREEIKNASINTEFKGFFNQSPIEDISPCSPATAEITYQQKAQVIADIIKKSGDLIVGGIFDTDYQEVLYLNSAGRNEIISYTSYRLDIRFTNSEGNTSSFHTRGRDLAQADFANLANEAIARCNKNSQQITIEDGNYPVFFAPAAMSELIYFTSLIGFGGREFKQKRSPFYNKLGQTIINNPLITLIDNPLNPKLLSEAVSTEGIARKPLTLIDKGVAVAMAQSLFTADSVEKATGHASGHAMLMELVPGNTSIDELRKTQENAVLISRFHYPTIDNPNRIILKGSTKDGTFIIKNGQYVAAKNLEFIVEIPVLLSKMQALSKETEVLPQGSLASSMPGANQVPWGLSTPLQIKDGILSCLD